ncbi:MAG TPA: SurA N-terminal domain-containing protein, partial [Terriglobia bacterium]|nr:SurA N-terminal domain-containing protein [Terriglobia bacterium]
MLDFMRKQSHNFKWVWIVLIFIFSVTLVTFYIPLGDLGSIRLSDDVATVGSESVTAREFQSSYQSYINRVGTQLSPEILKVYRFDLDILNSLIMQRVVATEAKRLGLGVSDAEVEQYIVNMQAFHDKDNNFIGVALYQQYLQSQYPPISVEEFEKSIRDQILQEKLRTLVTASIAVTDKEAEEEYRKRNEKAVLDYLVIDPTRLESQATASEQDIKDYYEKNKATYNIPERRQAKYVYLSAAKLGAMENPTDQEMLDYYNQHQSDYRTAETVTAQHILFKLDPNASPAQVEAIQEKARGVLERARMGEDFAALARQFSDDTTAARGGNLGPIQRGQMVPEFEKAVFDLNTGGVSDLVKTQFGYH